MRDRLIEKIKDSLNKHIGKSCLLAENIADDLLQEGVIVPSYKPFPVVMSEDENNSDVFCPFCDTNLTGNYYGGDYEPPKVITCFGCGTWLDGMKAITKEEAKQALKGGVQE